MKNPKSIATRWRVLSLVSIHVLAAAHFLHWKMTGRTMAPVEPSEMFDTLHLGVITVGFIFTAGVILATAFVGRLFCGWGCHILALQDLAGYFLNKVGVTPRPVRSRVLAWGPAMAAIYLFVWPQLERILLGQPLPALSIVTDRDEWTSLTTDDLLRSFPGLAMTIMTLGVCGFAIVYFLGSRSFCSYVCPYGAIFGGVEKISPLRIVPGDGDCSSCGLCVAVCKSQVRVIDEVRRHGMVVDSNCFKDFDCVSVCPTNAITVGLTAPPALRRAIPDSSRKKYDFSAVEEGILCLVFILTAAITRGLYDSISLLLGLSLAAITAYATVVGYRLISKADVYFRKIPLRKKSTLTRPGRAAAVVVCGLWVVLLDSAVVRFYESRGDAAANRMAMLERLNGSEAMIRSEAQLALSNLQSARRWALVTPDAWRTQMAALYLRSRETDAARREANVILATHPESLRARLLVTQSWLIDDRLEMARQQALEILSCFSQEYGSVPGPLHARKVVSEAYYVLGDIAGRTGHRQQARRYFQSAVAAYSKHGNAQFALGSLLAEEGRLEDARTAYESALSVNPNHEAARRELDSLSIRTPL